VLARNAEELLTLVKPGDVVVIHDPQPAGLVQTVKDAGARVLWRCHVGVDEPNPWTQRAWEFLHPYLLEADAYVVSRAAFAPPWADASNLHVIPPSIDPFSAKNEPMSHRNVRIVLSYVGLLDGDGSPSFRCFASAPPDDPTRQEVSP
jgi:trehalose synthase